MLGEPVPAFMVDDNEALHGSLVGSLEVLAPPQITAMREDNA